MPRPLFHVRHKLSMFCVQLPHADHRDTGDEIQWLQITDRCKRRAEDDDLPLRQIFDDVHHASPTQDSTCHSLILRSVCASVAVAYSQHQQCLLRTDTVFCKMQSPTASCMWCLLSVAICITQRTSHNFNYLDICCSLSTGLFDYVANHIMCCDSVVAAKCWYLSKVAFCIIFKNLLSSWHYVPKMEHTNNLTQYMLLYLYKWT